jgi:hypothetical protein
MRQQTAAAGFFGVVGASSLFWLWSYMQSKNAQEDKFRQMNDRGQFVQFYNDTIEAMGRPENIYDRPYFEKRVKDMEAYAAKYHIEL